MFKKNLIRRIRKILKKQRQKYLDFVDGERKKFISVLNHDIKTPILAQNQALRMLLKENNDEILKEITNSNYFLLQIVINSIFLQKYELEKPKLNLEKISILSEIQNCVDEINLMANEKKQKIILNMQKDVELNADRALVQKIIFNILTSSIVFGYENSDVEIFIEENKNKVSFCAKNKSIYMTKEKMNDLFTEEKPSCRDFNQLGMNLNLNIAKKLIKAHNWEMIALSKKDNSSVFGFSVKK